jgi:hypothetical protein
MANGVGVKNNIFACLVLGILEVREIQIQNYPLRYDA